MPRWMLRVGPPRSGWLLHEPLDPFGPRWRPRTIIWLFLCLPNLRRVEGVIKFEYDLPTSAASAYTCAAQCLRHCCLRHIFCAIAVCAIFSAFCCAWNLALAATFLCLRRAVSATLLSAPYFLRFVVPGTLLWLRHVFLRHSCLRRSFACTVFACSIL